MPKRDLPKLTRPRAQAVVPRTRLFDLIDRRRAKPVIWISSPPGAGKTTLVASYLEARKSAHVWYQVDSADNDPATFFYYLAMSVRSRKPALPLLTPEHLHDLGAFARRYFRNLFAMLPRPAILVLDNYQEAAPSSALHAMLREGFDEVPEGVNVIVISRAPPPNHFARLLATETLGQLQWGHLRLTSTESAQIARARKVTEAKQVEALCQRSDGWAAGLILMLAHGQPQALGPSDGTESRQAVFDYFAGELFDKTPVRHQEILMRTAFLTHFTAEVAEEITGERDAGEILDMLQRRNYFIERRDGEAITYQYHAMFREFLTNCARRHFSAQAYDECCNRAADALLGAGHLGDAIALCLRTGALQHATHAVLTQAPALLATGRGETLRAWIDAFPKHHVRAMPWLTYWYGTSLIQVSPIEARHELQAAYDLFHAALDSNGQAVSAASIVQTYYFDAQDFTGIDPWIPILEGLLEERPRFASVEAELAAYTGLVMALVYRRPGDLRLCARIDHLLTMVDAAGDRNQAASALLFVLSFSHFSHNDERRIRAVQRAHVAIADEQVSHLTRALLLHRLAFLTFLGGDYAGARQQCASALKLAESDQLVGAEAILYWLLAQMAAVMGDRRAGVALWQRFGALTTTRAMDAIYLAWAKGALHSLRGEKTQALASLRPVLAAVDQLGITTLRTAFRLPLALALLDAGELEEALQRLQEAMDNVQGSGMVRLEAGVHIVSAYAALLREDRPRCHDALRRGLELAQRADSYMIAAGYRSTGLSRLWSEALRMDIETRYVRELVRRHAYPPPGPDAADWPWPIHIRTLGRFEIRIDDDPLTFSGRTPRQPLQLLRLLVALRGEAAADVLCEALWPDAEGDTARISLEAALHRLRKLLGRDDAVHRQANALRLDPASCWVDAFAFDSLAERTLNDARAALDREAAERCIALYRGSFLPEQGGEAWALAARERLRASYLRVVELRGEDLESAGRWTDAAALYERALAQEPTAEPLYRRLMICHRERGEPGEAAKTYHRCRKLLASMLGSEPSPATQRLFLAL